MIITGDSLIELKKLEANSVDAIVTDPPYGLSFMGKKWDYDVPSVELWKEVYRVLKPGGHLLSFGGTRTYHRLVVAIEDAGFEIRDQIQWLYGSGFPKSMDISKQIDKQAGAKREVLGENPNSRPKSHLGKDSTAGSIGYKVAAYNPITAPATEAAKTWQGWGTALKPANEPICVARKPLEKGLTVAANVLKWGTGAINIDESRISTDVPRPMRERDAGRMTGNAYSGGQDGTLVGSKAAEDTLQGRWPANVILDEEAAKVLDEQTQHLHGAGQKVSRMECRSAHSGLVKDFAEGSEFRPQNRFGDSGGASRFFYVAKASKSERNAGLEGMPLRKRADANKMMGNAGPMKTGSGNDRTTEFLNHHPTVKPIRLMEYLIRMVTPPMGIVLDPFAGSGTTGVAAKNLGFNFIGIELSEEYAEIAKKRIEAA